MLTPTARKLLLAVHLTCSVGWVGAVCAYLVLAFAVPATSRPETIRSCWIGMQLIGWYAVVPLAVMALATGVVLALGTRWGLLRHYWVLISFVGTTLLTVVLLLHMPAVSAQADLARTASAEHLAGMGSDIPHAAIGLVLLLGILVLNTYKPRGLTRYGWRRERARTADAAGVSRGA